MRVLVALDDRFRLYREAVATIIRNVRPHIKVEVAEPAHGREMVARFDPLLVICNRPYDVSPHSRLAWFELRVDEDRVGLLCIGGEYRRFPNPAVDELLAVVDETEKLSRHNGDRNDC